MDAPGDTSVDVPISALEHYSYCPRQCALIHVEQTWDENLYTIRGQHAHERVDAGESSATGGVRTLRDIPVWSDRHGLRGKVDVLELQASGPVPVEYKVGRPHGPHASLQVCAQALCLEEMLGTSIPRGVIYYHAVRRRTDVELDDALRAETLRAIEAIRAMLREQSVPPAPNDLRCPKCSLLHSCLPAVVAEANRLRGLSGALFRPIEAIVDDA